MILLFLMSRSLRANNQMSLVVALSVVSEASILIFTFYWAPLLSSVFAESVQLMSSSSLSSSSSSSSSLASHAMMNAATTVLTTSPPAPPGAAMAIAAATSGVASSIVEGIPSGFTATVVRRLLDEGMNLISESTVVTNTPIPFMMIYASFMMSTMLGML